MTEPARHDWKKLIEEIEAQGITLYKLALMMHRQHHQVKAWKNGREPKHYEGEMLLALHSHFVGPNNACICRASMM